MGRLLCRASVAESSAHRLYASSERPTLLPPGRSHASFAAGRRFEPEGRPRRIRNLPPIPWATPLLRFGPLQRPQQEESFFRRERRKRPPHRLQLCLGRNLSASRVSHSLDGLLLFQPCQLISSDKHSWGLCGPLPESPQPSYSPLLGARRWLHAQARPEQRPHTKRARQVPLRPAVFPPGTSGCSSGPVSGAWAGKLAESRRHSRSIARRLPRCHSGKPDSTWRLLPQHIGSEDPNTHMTLETHAPKSTVSSRVGVASSDRKSVV